MLKAQSKMNFLQKIGANGACLLTHPKDIKHLADMTIQDNGAPDRKYVGKDATFILDAAGISYTGDPKLIMMDVDKDNPLVKTEMLMPILPIVGCPDFDSVLATAVEVEGGDHHTSLQFTQTTLNTSTSCHRMNTSSLRCKWANICCNQVR